MGHYSNGGLSCFSGTWSQLLSCLSQLRLIGTTDPKAGPAQVSNRCPFDIRGAKTPVSECAVWAVVSDSLWLYPFRLLFPRDSPGKNTGVHCHFLLQGIFLIQGSNSGLVSPALAGGFFARAPPGKPQLLSLIKSLCKRINSLQEDRT